MTPCRQLSEGPCKTYLLVSPKGSGAVLVDPVLDNVQAYLDLLSGEGLVLRAVVDTHVHADHLSGAAALSSRADAPYIMHQRALPACVSRKVADGETIGIGDLRLGFLHTPGHTMDSLTVVLEDRILSGDFLFIGSYGAGRLDLPGSDPSVHFDSLKKLDALPDGLGVWPAHDYQGLSHSTLAAERRANPVLQPRSREAYLRWWQERRPGPADWMKDVIRANASCTQDPKAVAIPKEQAACACASGPQMDGVLEISPAELARLLHEDPKRFFLLDVRTPEEFEEDGRIPGAALIPVDELEDRVREVPAGTPLISICRSGKRAARAASVLKENGRGDVRVLAGGMLAWNEAGLPVAGSIP